MSQFRRVLIALLLLATVWVADAQPASATTAPTKGVIICRKDYSDQFKTLRRSSCSSPAPTGPTADDWTIVWPADGYIAGCSFVEAYDYYASTITGWFSHYSSMQWCWNSYFGVVSIPRPSTSHATSDRFRVEYFYENYGYLTVVPGAPYSAFSYWSVITFRGCSIGGVYCERAVSRQNTRVYDDGSADWHGWFAPT